MSDKSASIAAWEALFRAQVSVLRELHTGFPTQGLAFNEYDVLFNLSLQPDRQARLRDLNGQLLLTQPSISRLVDRLASRGLVAKAPDPDDGRGTIVAMTDAGYEKFVRVAVEHAEAIHRRVGSALTNEELATLAALSDKLRRGSTH